jgi:hypothetical protein
MNAGAPTEKQVNSIPPFASPAKDGAPAEAKAELRRHLPECYHPHESAPQLWKPRPKREGWATRLCPEPAAAQSIISYGLDRR